MRTQSRTAAPTLVDCMGHKIKGARNRHATIDVVTDDSGRRTWTPGKCDAVLGRRRAATCQRLLGGRVGSIAGERYTGRRRTTGLGREANREGHALAGRQGDRKSKTADLKL